MLTSLQESSASVGLSGGGGPKLGEESWAMTDSLGFKEHQHKVRARW